MTTKINKPWYLLYGGESTDGRGYGIYEGRTTNKKIALAHFKQCRENPYSIGFVYKITDDKLTRVMFEGDID